MHQSIQRILSVCLICGTVSLLESASSTSISRTVGGHTITFSFDKAYECGRFVNGEPWVVGPVTITGISPAGEANGAESNPSSATWHGVMYDWPSYARNNNIMTKLPYTAQPGESIIKRVRKTSGCLTPATVGKCSAAFDVLTVLSAVPPDNGATIFRPPFAGTDKPLRSINKVMMERLPRIQMISDHGSQTPFGTIAARWNSSSYELCHEIQSEMIRAAVPIDVVGNDYAATIAGYYLNDMISTFGTEPNAQKAPAVYALMQRGFDILAIYKLGISLGSGAGQHLGKKPQAVFAAALYDDPALVTLIRGSAARDGVWFQEDDQIRQLTGRTTPVWGDVGGGCADEETYWANLYAKWIGGADNKKTCGDPYGYIDGPGGNVTNSSYQYCCSAGPFSSFVFAMHLMPWMKYANNDLEIITYIDRIWNGRGIDDFNGGWWAAPDPCAPPDPRESIDCRPYTANNDGCIYYKKTWGPDPAKPGDCIRHNGDPMTDGRWSNYHGTYTPPTEWLRRSYIVTALWTRFRDCADPDHPSYPCTGLGPEVESNHIAPPRGYARNTAAVWTAGPNPSAGPVIFSHGNGTGTGGRLTIYNSSGDRVYTASFRNSQVLVWDGRDHKGAKAAAGIYYFRIDMEHQFHSGRIMITNLY